MIDAETLKNLSRKFPGWDWTKHQRGGTVGVKGIRGKIRLVGWTYDVGNGLPLTPPTWRAWIAGVDQPNGPALAQCSQGVPSLEEAISTALWDLGERAKLLDWARREAGIVDISHLNLWSKHDGPFP